VGPLGKATAVSDLVWSDGADVRIRLARAGESGEFADRVAKVNVPFEDLGHAIDDGTVGIHVRTSYANGNPEALKAAAANVRPGPDALPFLVGLSLPLVAVDVEERIIGALQAIAPGNIMSDMRRQGFPDPLIMAFAIRAVKVASLWVDERHRCAGVGTALLHSCCQVYFGAGYRLLVGNYRTSGPIDLGQFYRAAGFRVLDPGESIPFGITSTAMVDIGTNDPDQRSFVLTRAEWRNLHRL
jgi:GNAT superfamily N-acetyltransferase